jgi:hypothetical protein
MQSTTIPSASRRRCLCQLRQSAKAGSSLIDIEMAANLGVATDLSGEEVHTAILLPTLSSSSEDVFLESYDVACYLRYLMAESTNIDGTRKFREWPCVHHLSTHSNSTGCSSLTTSGLEIAFVSGTHTGAFQPS